MAQPPPVTSASPLNGLAQDVRYAIRLLLRQRRYALVAILTMAVGIGATTTLFSVTYGVLMQPLPWKNAARVVVLKETRGGNAPRFGSFSDAAYLAWTEQASTIDGIAAWSERSATLTNAGDPERIRVNAASAGIFSVLGVRPLIGSLFTVRDETSPVIVISEGLWRQRFGGDPQIVGRTVNLDGSSHVIIGVLPDDAGYPDQQVRAWVPFPVRPARDNSMSMFQALALLRPGTSPAQAAAEGTARGRFAADTGMTTMAIFGSNGPIEITAQPLRDALTADVRRPLIVLLVGVSLLLVTATANIAGLQLARATTRRREISIRAALGAGTARVTRQLLVESLIVSLAGGGAGLAVAWPLHRVLPSLLPPDFPRVAEISISATVIGFALLISVITGVLVGVLPALRVRRFDLIASLAEDSTAPVGGGGRTGTARARMLIMAGQIAIACILLVNALLLGRSFSALLSIDRGYNPSGVVIGRVSMPASTHTPARRFGVLSQVLQRLSQTPGVSSAGFTSELPLTPGGSTAAFTLRSRAGNDGIVQVQASPRIVSPRYFAAVGMRVTEGRGFSDDDTDTSAPVAVVNRAFARRYLGRQPIGATVPMGVGYQQEQEDATVIGVIDDARYLTAGNTTQPEIYYVFTQLGGGLPVSTVTLVARTTGDPAALMAPLRTAVRDADATLAAEAVTTLEDRMLRGLARPRLYAILLGGFAAFAVVVAAVGLFGVLSYTLAQRSRELAIRRALGATRVDIVRLVTGQSTGVTLAGRSEERRVGKECRSRWSPYH